MNDDLQIRFKEKHLTEVLEILSKYKPKTQESIIKGLVKLIEHGMPKYKWFSGEDFESVIELVNGYIWAADLKGCLESKALATIEKEG